MPLFRYTARSREGARVEGALESPNRAACVRKLQAEGLAPIEIVESGGSLSGAPPTASGPAPIPARFRGARRWRPSALAAFTRELGDLLGAGMTLGRALHTLAQRRDDPRRARLFEELRDEIVQGANLSDALERRSGVFPSLYIGMVRAGEAGGRLGETLARLAGHYERLAAAQEKARSALVYPLFVLVVGGATMIFTLTYVLPKFTAIFDELGSALPAATRALIAVSRGLRQYGLWIALLLIGAMALARRALQTPAGRYWRDRALLRLPFVRPVIEARAFGQFAATLGSLLENGVPVLRALAIAESTVGNRVIAEAVRDARERVTDGATISGPLAAGGVFPPLLTDMLTIGEESGDLPGALQRIAQRYEAELERRLRLLTTLIEPALILLVAVFVGLVAISMLSAVFDLTSGLKT